MVAWKRGECFKMRLWKKRWMKGKIWANYSMGAASGLMSARRKGGDLKQRLAWNRGVPVASCVGQKNTDWSVWLPVRPATVSSQTLFQVTMLPLYDLWLFVTLPCGESSFITCFPTHPLMIWLRKSKKRRFSKDSREKCSSEQSRPSCHHRTYHG